MIDPAFKNINRLFFLSVENADNDPPRKSLFNYHITISRIKAFDVLISKKSWFNKPVKNIQKTYEKVVQMSINDDDKTGNLLGYLYHQKYHKPIDIDLSRQANTNIAEQINSV